MPINACKFREGGYFKSKDGVERSKDLKWEL